ncbi:hypothetical protein [Neotamlana laminarinivorans]|uniref:Cytoskeletal protein CcmA (Bactofilin family) n=1 Tax=Neotamlana laminarinivorans TaxID=2883124 RepID=A0A9X1HYD8_9FLAO|nr:hypothetical protein [Tamlana laminarinivorans]MCB4797238.1 hypothetical protein [Tamlana laminarinivorans]
MKNLRVKAGALQLTVFIVVVVAVLLAGFVLLTHTQKQFKIKTAFIKETITNANSGINYMLANTIVEKDTTELPLNAPEFKTLKVYKSYWGIFQNITSVSQIHHNIFKKSAFVGGTKNSINQVALFLKDNNRPLVVVANTKIEGLSYIPKQGVRTGNISGHSYYGNQLIYGTTKTSSSKLPQISNRVLEEIKNIDNQFNKVDTDQFVNLKTSRTHYNSFFKSSKLIYSASHLVLSNVKIKGKFLVQSNTKITVEANTELNDIILIAPEIEVKSNTKGNFQAFASNFIEIGSNCKLQYPTALILNDKSKGLNVTSQDQSKIIINSGTEIKGEILYLGESVGYKPNVVINRNTTVYGEVYCEQNMELLGTVYGSVFTSSFVANQSGSSYQNHLYNAQISASKLPDEYIGVLFNNSEKGIAKWLY